jgi:hypothetical protein
MLTHRGFETAASAASTAATSYNPDWLLLIRNVGFATSINHTIFEENALESIK